MKAASQVVAYLSSFLVVFIFGHFFDIAYWQAGFHAKKLLNGKPLPPITQFFIEHHHSPAHLALLPWLALVGSPLLTLSSSRNFWDETSFTVRYLAFVSCEILVFLVLLLFLAIPYIPYYAVLEPFRESAPELIARLLFWFISTMITLAIFYRAYQLRNTRNA